MIEVKSVDKGPEIEIIRTLFLEYARDINLNLDLKGVDKDITDLPGIYSPPFGCLLLATKNDTPAGCVRLCKINILSCEMKRLFVRKQYRNLGIGRLLVTDLIERAGLIGYKQIRLDVIASLNEAVALYKSFGFAVTEVIKDDSSNDVLFMKRPL